MPSAAARRLYEDQIPSFMSVFDIETDALEQGAVTVADTKIIGMGDTQLSGFPTQQLHPTAATLPTDATHRHQDSTSTQNSESADSSPTTAGYGTDTASFSDPSPSSSPDSPINLVPLSSFPGPTFGPLPPLSILSVSEPQLERPVTSPSPRRPRNMKGLSIQPPFAPSQSPSLVSEPSSPVFIKPAIPAMKRKPSQLSLKTSTSDLIKASTTLDVPQSPSLPPILQRRALKHSTSSPHMLSSLKSATFGPAGGMTIPPVLERNESGLSSFLRPQKPKAPTGFDTTILEEESPIRTQIANRAAYDFEPYHEIENNEDQKTPGYPDGPIAIYSDNVYLYLEPTADEAAKFDVVINVAREVTNPFKARASSPSDHSDDIAMSADNSPIPDTALTGMSFATAFEYPPGDATPTTPKPCFPLNEPEYIHMPWEHNTDISTDLMSLCETIEKKTKEGKKVLIHCQQGASRSASLIIAYGMYQNPELSVNDAYHAAQAKSRWISPNMRLMYCLQDFQKDVSRRKLTPLSGFRPRSGRSPTKLHRAALSVDAIPIPPKEPLTAPLPSEDEIGVARSTSPERQSPARPRRNSTPGRDPISPGPSSAPSSFSWRDDMSDGPKSAHFETDKLFNRNSQPDSGFASSSSLEPYSNARPPPSPAFPPSNSFGSFALPPSSPGFAPMTFGSLVQPPTPQKAPPVGLAPLSFGSFALSNPPKSPGFAPSSMGFSKPPPSPGFGAHRFGGSSVPKDSFGFAPLQVGPPPLRALKKKASAPAITTIPPPLPSSTLATNNGEHKIAVMQSFPEDPCLMSPRVETMTNNPLHDPFANMTGMRFVEVPPTPSDGLFSPRETMFPRDPFYPFARPMQITDPRSPPTKGETPIVRSIDELI